MQELQIKRSLAPAGDFERVKRKLVRKLRLWRMTVIAGAAVAALVPAAVLADDGGFEGGGFLQTIQRALATLATHTTQIASLQSTDSGQNAQIALLKQQLQAQNAQIAVLQTQINNEAAARTAGDATGKTYTDTETARAMAAEGALATSLGKVDNSATLAAAKAYTDAQLAAEAARAQSAETGAATALSAETAARKQGDADTLSAAQASIAVETARAEGAEAGIVGPDHTYTDAQVAAEAAARQAADAALTVGLNNEVARAQGAEGSLLTALNNEITRAKAGEVAAITTIEVNLTSLANASSDAQDFWSRIKNAQFP